MCYQTAASWDVSFCSPTVHISSMHANQSTFQLRGDLETSGFSLCRWQKGWRILYMTPKGLPRTSVHAHPGAHTCLYAHVKKTQNAHTAHTAHLIPIFSKERHRFYASVRSNGCSVLCCWLGDFSCILALLETLNYSRLTLFPLT